jgi:hypothetical protein
MEWFLFWAVVNFIIGYLIGKPKGQAGGCVLICILLGPIGWVSALFIPGPTRRCPYCAQNTFPEGLSVFWLRYSPQTAYLVLEFRAKFGERLICRVAAK